MSAAATYTYDQNPPIRPGLSDLGGAQYADDPTYPPNTTTMPNALEHNERARNQAGLNRVCPSAILHIKFTSGTPSINAFTAMGTAVLTGSFTVTDNGAGDTSITWASTVLPTPLVPPLASISADADATIACIVLTGPNGVRVKTRVATVLTDVDFTVAIH